MVAGNVGKDSKPVYHLAISAARTDRLLTDAQWADIAGEYVHRIGLAPRGDDEAARWVAVRHAPDHVHVVATLVRQDGRRVFPRQDFLRSRDASRAVEARYRLTTTAPVGGTSTPETTRAEQRKHAAEAQRRRARGRPPPAGPDREVLRARVRDALVGSASWEEFTDRLRTDGVLVRPRFSTVNPDQITGYAVALLLTGRDASDGRQPIWFGGGKLAPDLTLPRLRARWAEQTTGHEPSGQTGQSRQSASGRHLSDAEREQLWRAAQDAVHRAQQTMRAAATGAAGPDGTPASAADASAAAAAASDMLHTISRLVEGKRGGPLRDAAEHYDRAARLPRRQTPPRTSTAAALRGAARGLLAVGIVRQRDTRELLRLMAQLASLADTVERLRQTQQQAARAHAARLAAEQLHSRIARYDHAAQAARPGAQPPLDLNNPTQPPWAPAASHTLSHTRPSPPARSR